MHWPHGLEPLASAIIYQQGACIWRRYWFKGWVSGLGISAHWTESGIVKDDQGHAQHETYIDIQEIRGKEFAEEEG